MIQGAENDESSLATAKDGREKEGYKVGMVPMTNALIDPRTVLQTENRRNPNQELESPSLMK